MEIFEGSKLSDTDSANSISSNFESETSTSDESYEKMSEPSIRGHYYQLPDFPSTYVKPTVLDVSLSHIPIYAHLKTYDLEPVQRPDTPPIVSTLRSRFIQDTGSSKSSRLVPSTARTTGTKSTISQRYLKLSN